MVILYLPSSLCYSDRPQAHERFLDEYGITRLDVPLLRLDVSDFSEPFTAGIKGPTLEFGAAPAWERDSTHPLEFNVEA